MRGESGHPDPEIRGGSWFQKMFFRWPFTPQFQVKFFFFFFFFFFMGGGGWPGPSPESAAAYEPVFRTLNCCELRGIQSAGGSKFRNILLNKNWAKNYYRHDSV